jgi:type II secretory pathway predicted ATPase ExeA
MNPNLQALYGLKWNPFSQEIPTYALYIPERMAEFCWRVENILIREGGFAMVHGDPGTGKSVLLRHLAGRLERMPELIVGTISHPQSQLGDFYREMGDVFGVPLTPSNRWGGFKALRERWLNHLETARQRPVLIIDEAQEMGHQVLNELRLMSSSRFDSLPLLCLILAGDTRLPERLRREELLPLGSRIRIRYATEYAGRDELLSFLNHLLDEAGNAGLMTPELRSTLCDHAAGNYRILTAMSADLLAAGAQKNLPQLDEKLFLEVYAQPNTPRQAKRGRP